MKNILKRRKILLQLIDISIMSILNLFMYFVMNKFIEMPSFSIILTQDVIMVMLVYIPRIALGVYKYSWRYASHSEYFVLIVADALGAVLFLFINYTIYGNMYLTLYYSTIFFLSVIFCASARLIYQLYMQHDNKKNSNNQDKIPVAIIGAGLNGTMLAQTLKKSSSSEYYPYCFIDIDKEKIGSSINGIKVYDANKDIVTKLKESPVKEIIIAINNLTLEQSNILFAQYSKLELPIRIFEYPHSGGEIDTKKQIRDIKIEDLLFRESIDFTDKSVYDYYSGKVIMVTGGGGSIGSELCRQIANLNPKQLIILDIYENNAYEVQQSLINKYGSDINLNVEIASIRDKHKINIIFEKYRPDIVFHAAAHKHVPLMESCCDEAIKNNVFGTYNVVNAAEAVGVKTFIAISTDKAVNPTNIMGATKRFCEMIIRSKKNSKTDFMAVRFGNVLGSNGSVIPLFQSQIAKGGPITLTDKRIIRYFMTIAEAVQLVMQAGVNAKKSDIFVLDMGQPIKILTLAENLIKLSGLRPYIDIDIKEIGLRPGEKLYEELLIDRENLTMTDNKKIFIEQEEIITQNEIDYKLEQLRTALITDDNEIIRSIMMEVVPTFRNPDEINKAM